MGTTVEEACSGDKVGSRKTYMQHRRGKFRRANRHRACSRGRGRARCCSRRGREILGTRCPGAVLGLLFPRPCGRGRVQSRWWRRVVGMGNLWRCPATPWCTWRRRVEERQRLSSLALRLARKQESSSAPIANYDRHPACLGWYRSAVTSAGNTAHAIPQLSSLLDVVLRADRKET